MHYIQKKPAVYRRYSAHYTERSTGGQPAVFSGLDNMGMYNFLSDNYCFSSFSSKSNSKSQVSIIFHLIIIVFNCFRSESNSNSQVSIISHPITLLLFFQIEFEILGEYNFSLTIYCFYSAQHQTENNVSINIFIIFISFQLDRDDMFKVNILHLYKYKDTYISTCFLYSVQHQIQNTVSMSFHNNYFSFSFQIHRN